MVIAERPSIGHRPLLRFCPIDEPERRLRLTRLDAGEIGLLADEEIDLTPFIGTTISVVGRSGRNWIYGVTGIRTESARPTVVMAPSDVASPRASATAPAI
jgi:hypothetical protein